MELLIEELNHQEGQILTEVSQKTNDIWLSGIYMQSEIKNRNGRSYPLNEISAAVEMATQRIKESRGLMGELDHPQSLNINLDRVSHVITEMNMMGQNALGKSKLLSTPMGNIAKELVKADVALGVSSRGAGNVDESGGVSGFQFVTVDIVAQPSAAGAVPDAVYESLMEAKNGNTIISLSEAVRDDPAAQKYFKKEIEKWLSENLFKKR